MFSRAQMIHMKDVARDSGLDLLPEHRPPLVERALRDETDGLSSRAVVMLCRAVGYYQAINERGGDTTAVCRLQLAEALRELANLVDPRRSF